jgi:long-chain acyl-CoA synthetase
MTMLFFDWKNLDKPALLTEDDQTFTYGQLRALVKSFAQGIPDRQLVFLVGKNDLPSIVAYLGVIEAGAVPLLLNKDMSSASLKLLLDIYSPTYVFLPQEHPLAIGYGRCVSKFEFYDLLKNERVQPAKLHSDLGLLLTTSGSTGSPKLVRLSLKNISVNAQSIVEYLGIDNNERAITSLPFNYSYGLSVINSHLVAGGSLSLTDRGFFDSSFWRQVKDQAVTSIAGVPYSYEILLKLRFERMNFPSLRTLTQAGGRLDPEIAKKIGEIAKVKGISFFTMYGQTEASPRIAFLPPDKLLQKLGSIGCSIPGGRLWLEDDQGQVITSANQKGELIYSGPNVSLGYAEKREDLMLGDTFKGVLRTGDLARQDEDKFFFIEGRKHRFLKVFGVRVSLDAVEAWVAQHKLVGAAHGKDDFLCVSLVGDVRLDQVEFARALSADLGIHPSALKINILDALPRLVSNKVDYACLQKMQ